MPQSLTQVCFIQSPWPFDRPLLTCTSIGDSNTGLAQSLWAVHSGPLSSYGHFLFYYSELSFQSEISVSYAWTLHGCGTVLQNCHPRRWTMLQCQPPSLPSPLLVLLTFPAVVCSSLKVTPQVENCLNYRHSLLAVLCLVPLIHFTLE